ncbi:MAG: FAD-dependent oxidoreductase [Fimbriimonadales bacterium]|nr:FAD-dependent oxidoreductase [Fimbriimonadales bacterium]
MPVGNRPFYDTNLLALGEVHGQDARTIVPHVDDVDVLVLGAGLAGSVAAYQLQLAGCRVALIEARARVGGRAHTTYDWAEGQYAELGPEFIDSNHYRVLSYAGRFGIPIRRRQRFWGISPLRGDSRASREAWNRFWHAALEQAQIVSTKSRSLTRLLQRLQRLAPLDQVTMRDFAEQLGIWQVAAPHLIRYSRNLEAAEPEEVSMLSVIAQEAFYGADVEHGAYRLEGGTQRLVEAMVGAFQEAGGTLMLQTAAEAIEQVERGVRVHVRQQEQAQTLRARYAVVALPFTMLSQLELRPPLSPARIDALSQLGVGQVVKTLLQFRTRFWRQQTPRGIMPDRSHLPDISAIWEETDIVPGEAGILSLWVGGEPARRWARFTEVERIERCLQMLETLYPSCRSQFLRGVSLHWGQEPFTRLGYPFQPPGLLTGGFRALFKPEGRLYFAGDYLSLFVGYMEGALESGERAAQALLKRLKRYTSRCDGRQDTARE